MDAYRGLRRNFIDTPIACRKVLRVVGVCPGNVTLHCQILFSSFYPLTVQAYRLSRCLYSLGMSLRSSPARAYGGCHRLSA